MTKQQYDLRCQHPIVALILVADKVLNEIYEANSTFEFKVSEEAKELILEFLRENDIPHSICDREEVICICICGSASG